MTYSRKRYWLALGAALAFAVAFLVLTSWLHPAHIGLVVMAMVLLAVCGALAFLAYFSLDEIQRQNEMRAWYYGGLLASLFGVAPLLVLMPNVMLKAMAGLLPNASRMAPDMLLLPRNYFCMGVVVTFVLQAIGHFIAHAIFKVAGRAR
jgi:uncharacterized membrane protein